MRWDGGFEPDAQAIAAGLRQGRSRIVEGPSVSCDALFAAVEAHLGSDALRVHIPSQIDRVTFAILTLAEQVDATGSFAEALASGDVEAAIGTVEAERCGRVVLVSDLDRLTIRRVWNLDDTLRSSHHAVRQWLQDIPHLGALTAGAGSSDAIAPRFAQGSPSHALWQRAKRDPERFSLLGTLDELSANADGELDSASVDDLADAVLEALPGDLRRVTELLAVHDRPVSNSILFAVRPTAEALKHGRDLGVMECSRDTTWLHSPLAIAARRALGARAHELHLRWGNSLAAMARQDASPSTVLEAHRHLVAAGVFQAAREFARFGAEVLIDGAREASLAERWDQAIEGYDAALSLTPHQPRARAYARHYLHYNRYRAEREDLLTTLKGYECALDDWQDNALFWSRRIGALVQAEKLSDALDAMDRAYATVPKHPQRDRYLRVRTVEHRMERRQWLAALALWQDQAPLDVIQHDVVERLHGALAAGVSVNRLWIDHAPPVILTECVRLRVFQRNTGYIAVVPGFRSAGTSSTAAVYQLIEDVRSAWGSSSPCALRSLANGAWEKHYQRLGRTVGEDATPEARQELATWWSDQCNDGIRWIVSRVRSEWHAEVMDAVTRVLITAGEDAAVLVLEALEQGSTEDGCRALVLALTKLPLTGIPNDRLKAVVRRLLDAQDPDLRELAAEVRDRFDRA